MRYASAFSGIGTDAIAWRGKSPEKCPDGPRYRAIGNGMAMPVLRWIGERIAKVENLIREKRDER